MPIKAPVEVGISTALVTPVELDTLALQAEALGYDSVWVAEHLVFPHQLLGTPRHDEREFLVDPSTPLVDPFVALAFVAARTSRIGIGTGIFNVALRHPFAVSRAAVTLAELAPNRLEIGVGAGWLPTEYDVMGLDFDSRGKRLDEALAIIRATWSDEIIEYHGDHFEFPPVVWQPKPGIPPRLHIAGEVAASFRRVAQYGDGWMAMDHTPDSIAPVIVRMHDAVRRHGRDPSQLQVTLVIDAKEHAGHVREVLDRLASVGVTRAIFGGLMPFQEKLAAIEQIADELSK